MSTPGSTPNDDGKEMLPQSPPPLAVRGIASLLLALFAVALIAAVVVRIPETVRCPFHLVSEAGSDPVQAPLAGTLDEILVREGDAVQGGQKLFVLRSDEIRNWQTELSVLQNQLASLIQQEAKRLQAHETQLNFTEAERSQIEQEISFRRKFTETSLDFSKRLQALASQGIVAEVEILSKQLELAEAEKDLSVAEKSLQQLDLQRARLESEHLRQSELAQSDREQLELKIHSLRDQLEHCVGQRRFVTAPYDGVVTSVSVQNAGGIVARGQPLGEIARARENPKARLSPGESDLAQLSPGQPVRLFFSAFPYQRHGTVRGQLTWVSPAMVGRSDSGGAFLATVELASTKIGKKPEERPLRVGMSGEAQVTVGRRTLVEYLFEPLHQLRENLSGSSLSDPTPPPSGITAAAADASPTVNPGP